MKLSHTFALLAAGVVACDAWLASAGSSDAGAPAVNRVSLLSLLQVGPSLPGGDVRGGAECDCFGLENSGSCAEDIAGDLIRCIRSYSKCEASDSSMVTNTGLCKKDTANKTCTTTGCAEIDSWECPSGGCEQNTGGGT